MPHSRLCPSLVAVGLALTLAAPVVALDQPAPAEGEAIPAEAPAVAENQEPSAPEPAVPEMTLPPLAQASPGAAPAPHPEHGAPPGSKGQPAASPHAGHTPESHDRHGADHGPQMEAHIPGLTMSRRMGSGTSWLPDVTPMWMLHWPREPWELMLMGNVFLDYVAQGGPRGIDRFVSQNWAMGMANRPIGSQGDLMLRLMMSLEPATVGNNGVPQLYQTGEGLIDRQHPHDLFMEIAAQYTQRISRDLAWSLYLAPVGEPALGPVAYPHRISAWDNPQTPLAHHLQDSTHIAYGVITGGIQSERWKLEGSWFNAREPDDKRWAFDPVGLNSPSVRLWYNPNENWSLQVSRGWLKSPEQDEPGDIRRTTASATYVQQRPRGYWAASFIWGRNDEEGHGDHAARTEDSFALEGVYNWADRNYLFGRIESLDRDGLFERGPRAEQVFTVNAFTLGYSREVGRVGGLDALIGGSLTFHAAPSELRDVYGDFPIGVHVFLRLRPGRMRHNDTVHEMHAARRSR